MELRDAKMYLKRRLREYSHTKKETYINALKHVDTFEELVLLRCMFRNPWDELNPEQSETKCQVWLTQYDDSLTAFVLCFRKIQLHQTYIMHVCGGLGINKVWYSLPYTIVDKYGKNLNNTKVRFQTQSKVSFTTYTGEKVIVSVVHKRENSYLITKVNSVRHTLPIQDPHAFTFKQDPVDHGTAQVTYKLFQDEQWHKALFSVTDEQIAQSCVLQSETNQTLQATQVSVQSSEISDNHTFMPSELRFDKYKIKIPFKNAVCYLPDGNAGLLVVADVFNKKNVSIGVALVDVQHTQPEKELIETTLHLAGFDKDNWMKFI